MSTAALSPIFFYPTNAHFGVHIHFQCMVPSDNIFFTITESFSSSPLTLSFSPYSWWRHQMEAFSALLALCAGYSQVTGEFPSQRPVTRSFDISLIWTNGWANNRNAGDLRRHRAYYDVILMYYLRFQKMDKSRYEYICVYLYLYICRYISTHIWIHVFTFAHSSEPDLVNPIAAHFGYMVTFLQGFAISILYLQPFIGCRIVVWSVVFSPLTTTLIALENTY